jgi:methylase of polypeptide subunit release factors
MAVFKRNLTSILLEKALRDTVRTYSSEMQILELGCGDGNITRTIAAEFRKNKYFASDVSFEAVAQALALCEDGLNDLIEFKQSNGLDAWASKTFDVILCDISAINQSIAELSDWYVGVQCNTSEDGLGAVRPIILNAKNYLNPGGIFILPTISLSNTTELEKLLNNSFSIVSLVESKDWPMPKDLTSLIISNSVQGKGTFWNTTNKFGMEIATTGVLLCKI